MNDEPALLDFIMSSIPKNPSDFNKEDFDKKMKLENNDSSIEEVQFVYRQPIL